MRYLQFILFMILGLCQSALAQTINPTAITVTPPTGTAASPHFVIDQDSGAAPETRNKIPVSVVVSFPLTTTGPSFKARISAQLLTTDGKNTSLKLETGSELSSVLSVSTKGTGTGTQTFTLSLDPGSNLGAGIAYKVRAQFQVQSGTSFVNAGTAVDSAAFTVVHFAKEADAHLNVKVHARTAPALIRGFALSTSGTQNSFRVSVPLLISRYDPGDVARDISFRLTTTLLDDLGNSIPLASGAIESNTMLASDLGAFISGSPNRPAAQSRVVFLNLVPRPQIDSVNRTYRVRVAAEVNQSASAGAAFENEGNVAEMPGLRLLHFNGRLNFGTVTGRVVETRFNQVNNTPAPGGFKPNPPSSSAPQTNGITTELSFSTGTIPGQSVLQYGPASLTPVILKATGEAVFAGTQEFAVTLAASANPGTTVGGIRLDYQNIRLRSSGAVADVRVRLPQGLGFTEDRANARGRFQPLIQVDAAALSNTFGIAGSLSLSGLGADPWVFDEARPLLFKLSRFDLLTDGTLSFQPVAVEWAHKAAYDLLAAQATTAVPLPAQHHRSSNMDFRSSNDGYLQFVQLPASAAPITFVRGPDGTARTKAATLVVGAGSYNAHLPSSNHVKWTAQGDLHIREGYVDTGASRLPAVPDDTPLDAEWTTTCKSDCLVGSNRLIRWRPQGEEYRFSPDGGLQMVQELLDAEEQPVKFDLRWDPHEEADFTHRVLDVAGTHLVFAGHQIYASDSPANDENMAATLLQAGFEPLPTPHMVYAGSQAYQSGEGAYPGMNFTVPTTGTTEARLQLSDSEVPSHYVLRPGLSKYHVTKKGVSGRTVAVDMAGGPPLIYGYNVIFTRFETAFLDNGNTPVPEPSRINGRISIPGFNGQGAGFTQDFIGLQLGCQGVVLGGQIDPEDTEPKTLAYTGARVTPLGIRFEPLEPDSDNGCNTGPRRLTMMVETTPANLFTRRNPLEAARPLTVVGTLGFKPDGNLSTLAEQGNTGVSSRLGLPARVLVRGPGTEEFYPVTPISQLYLSNPAEPNAPPLNGFGFLNFAGSCAVPYFPDLNVHVQTKADPDSPAAPTSIFMAGSWNERAVTHFTSVRADPLHRGFPNTILLPQTTALADYRNPQPDSNGQVDERFLIKAYQSVFGLFDFDHPLLWSAVSRDFRGLEEDTTDKLIIKGLQYQVDYLSAKRLDLSFGARLDALAHINLASLLTTQINPAFDNAHANVTGAAVEMMKGVEGFDEFVSSSLDEIIDQMVQRLDLSGFDGIHNEITTFFTAKMLGTEPLRDFLTWRAELTAKLRDDANESRRGMRNSIQEAVAYLAQTKENDQPLLDAVDRLILTLDMIGGRFRVDEQNRPINQEYEFVSEGGLRLVPPVDEARMRNGVVTSDPVTQRRDVLNALVDLLIRETLDNADPALVGVLNNIDLSSLESELLKDFDGPLDALETAVLGLKSSLVAFRNSIILKQGLVQHLEEALAALNLQIDALVADLVESALTAVDEAAELALGSPVQAADQVLNFLDEFDQDDFRALMQREFRDKIMASDICRIIQTMLRRQISELNFAVHSVLDQANALTNFICRGVVKLILGGLEDAVSQGTGVLADITGVRSLSGQAEFDRYTLRGIRLDADLELKLPEKLRMPAFFEFRSFDSSTTQSGAGACPGPVGAETVEIRIGARNVPLDFKPSMLVSTAEGGLPDTDKPRADMDLLVSLSDSSEPVGLGGGFNLVSGKLGFDGMDVTSLAGSVNISARQRYIAASTRVKVSGFEGGGGLFVGTSCSLDPLRLVDPQVATVVGTAPVAGIYAYGEVWVPISEVVFGIPSSCMFRVSAGVGLGLFSFDGPLNGGRLKLGLSGEALCAVSVTGEVSMVGVFTDDGMRFQGTGSIRGSAGICPLCLIYEDTLFLTYQGGAWDARRF